MTSFTRALPFLFLCLGLTITVSCSSQQVPLFVPTHEFKPILPGQAIPGGLHVRVNLESGLKEAKLVSPEPENPSSDSVFVSPETTESFSLSLNDVKNSVMNVLPSSLQVVAQGTVDSLMEIVSGPKEISPVDSDDKKSISIQHASASPDSSSKSQPKWNLPLEEAEALSSVLDAITDLQGTELLDTLESLHDWVHQIDYGVDFTKHEKGIESMLYLLKHHNDPWVRALSAGILGGAFSNNPLAQKFAHAKNILPSLLDHLTKETDPTAFRRLCHALSSFLRGNIPAVQDFLASKTDKYGIKTLKDLVEKWKHDSIVSKKLISLVGDLFDQDMYEPSDTSSSSSFLDQFINTILPSQTSQATSHWKDWCNMLQSMAKSDISRDAGLLEKARRSLSALSQHSAFNSFCQESNSQ